jgi:hypothetical protein
MMAPHFSVHAVLAASTILGLLSGCGRGRAVEDYVPQSDTARAALERTLVAWKKGNPYGTIRDDSPAVDPFDARWQAGEKLESFTIGEEVPGQQHPHFKVTIQLEGQEPESNTYLVIGIDPLLVFRDVDYKKATGTGGSPDSSSEM